MGLAGSLAGGLAGRLVNPRLGQVASADLTQRAVVPIFRSAKHGGAWALRLQIVAQSSIARSYSLYKRYEHNASLKLWANMRQQKYSSRAKKTSTLGKHDIRVTVQQRCPEVSNSSPRSLLGLNGFEMFLDLLKLFALRIPAEALEGMRP